MFICYYPPVPNTGIKVEQTVNVDSEVSFEIKDCYRFIKYAAGLITLALTKINAYADVTTINQKVDATGWQLFGMARGFCFWGAVLLMIIDLVKNARKEDLAGMVRTTIGYVGWYTLIYFAPDIIKFGVMIFG